MADSKMLRKQKENQTASKNSRYFLPKDIVKLKEHFHEMFLKGLHSKTDCQQKLF